MLLPFPFREEKSRIGANSTLCVCAWEEEEGCALSEVSAEEDGCVVYGGGREFEWVCMCDQGGKKTNAHP